MDKVIIKRPDEKVGHIEEILIWIGGRHGLK